MASGIPPSFLEQGRQHSERTYGETAIRACSAREARMDPERRDYVIGERRPCDKHVHAYI